MTDTDNNLDAEVEAILAHEAARKTKKHKSLPNNDTMTRALNVAYARADRQHRKATESYEIKTFEI